MREYTIRDCKIVDVFDDDTEDLLFKLRRSIELAMERGKPAGLKCEVCQTDLGHGPGKCQPAKDKPTWCFECAVMHDYPSEQELQATVDREELP